MVEQTHRVRTISNDGEVTETTRNVNTANDVVAQEPVDTRANTYNRDVAEENRSDLAARIIWYVAGVIIALLALRFVLVLLGASQASGFVSFIYAISYPFAVPFFGMFNYNAQYGVSRFEASTLVAIAVYALIAWGLARLVTIKHPRTVY